MVICTPLITLCLCGMWNNQFSARNTALEATLTLLSTAEQHQLHLGIISPNPLVPK